MADTVNTFVVLLRGVMPSGKNRVPMAQLREILRDNGFQNVRTYIQTGNVVLETPLSADEVADQVYALIKKHIGADLKIIIRTGNQLERVLARNPFNRDEDLPRVFYVLFAETLPPGQGEKLMAIDYGEEKLVIEPDFAYMYIPGNAGRSKLSNVMLEKKLGIAATTRNYNTIKKMVEMSKS